MDENNVREQEQPEESDELTRFFRQPWARPGDQAPTEPDLEKLLSLSG